MVDRRGQVPSPSAADWLFELSAARDPRYVVLRLDEQEAREALAAHLEDIGAVAAGQDAREAARAAEASIAGLGW